MEYRRVGRTGLKVSAVSIGGWLTFGARVDETASLDILRAALDEGVNFIDLADVYGAGRAERTVGRLLGEARRDALVVSSKCYWPMGQGPNNRGLSRKHILESCEGSLRRLGTEYLDLYFCHREDDDTPLDETVRAMDDLVHQGKILYWGTSCWSARRLLRTGAMASMRGFYGPVVEQPQYSLLERGPEKGLFRTASGLGMGIVVWSPLAGGALTGKYDDGLPEGTRGAETEWLDRHLAGDGRKRLRRFSEIASDLGVRPAQLALAWCLRRPEVTSVITGATRVEQVLENVKAVDVELPREVQGELDTLFPR
ncbi:MAG: aldo/keto reductase family protein [Sandaracinaceae bacterium]